MAQNKSNISKTKTAIIILSALLALSVLALAVWLVFKHFSENGTSTSVAPDNKIAEHYGEGVLEFSVPEYQAENDSKKAEISLHSGQATDNSPFRVENMLPGDKVTGEYAVKISHHGDVVVYFSAPVTAETKELSDILHIKVTHNESGDTVCEGSFSSLSADGYVKVFRTNTSTETVATYTVEVSLPTSAGNEYQGASLTADFVWSVKDTAPLDPPQTGDSNGVIWIVAGISLVLLVLIIFIMKRRKEQDDDE